MENYIKARDYAILIYAKEDYEKYRAAMDALTITKKAAGWDSVQGVTINKDCRIPDLYHGGQSGNHHGAGTGKRRI